MFNKEEIIINNNNKLNGTVKIGGAKNSTVSILPAIVLANKEVILEEVPDISDVDTLIKLLEHLNVKVEKISENTYKFNTENIENKILPHELVDKLRASYYFMGSLISRFNKVKIGMPGGCYLGPRPINLHIKGFELLGINVNINDDNYVLKRDEIKSCHINLDFASVGATMNLILASIYNDGEVLIENAAKEPEVIDLSIFLNSMGAKIVGAGTDLIRIKGIKKELTGTRHQIIPDRIEAGTFLLLGAITRSNIIVKNVIPMHLDSLTSKLKDIGFIIIENDESIEINYDPEKKLKPVNIKTQIYPGFPTDLQQIMVSLLSTIPGNSTVEDTIYESRFRNCEELNKMGANITVLNNVANINGVENLYGKTVIASDLRAGAALLIAGAFAKGKTTIKEVSHILRGYEKIQEKLENLNLNIEIK